MVSKGTIKKKVTSAHLIAVLHARGRPGGLNHTVVALSSVTSVCGGQSLALGQCRWSSALRLWSSCSITFCWMSDSAATTNCTATVPPDGVDPPWLCTISYFSSSSPSTSPSTQPYLQFTLLRVGVLSIAISVSVSQSVCPLTYLKNHSNKFYQMFRICCL